MMSDSNYPPDQPAPDEPSVPLEPDDDADAGERDALSPAVRRLLKQYELDASTIIGSGPAGRIRVADVMAVLGARSPESNESAPENDDKPSPAAGRRERAAAVRLPTNNDSLTVTSTALFDCDMDRLLAACRTGAAEPDEHALIACFAAACARALELAPGIANGDGPVAVSHLSMEQPPPADADLCVYWCGSDGPISLTPAPIPPGNVAAVAVGRIEPRVVVRGSESGKHARIAHIARIALSFDLRRVSPHCASRFLAGLVKEVENWPETNRSGDIAND
jgi:pyruvate/2-oxoglutarate dehydrogenase complex dihydrolipoamide acyltransferase (E2) component